jgi:hypothetical protein
MRTSIVPAIVTAGRDPADYDDDALDRLADRIADRLARRLAGLTPTHAQPEPLVDAAEIARLHGKTRTDAGMREVDMLPLLREILTEHKAASGRTGPDDPVFVTSAGKPRSRQHPPGHRRRRGRPREQAGRGARPATPAAGDHPAQAPAYVRLDLGSTPPIPPRRCSSDATPDH